MEKQPLTQERNLTLEQHEADKRLQSNLIKQKELQKSGEHYEKDGKKFIRLAKGSQEYDEYMKVHQEVVKDLETSVDIDEYKKLATSKEQIKNYKIGDVSGFEQLTQEKEKVDEEVKKTKADIEEKTKKLNDLRKKLELQETDDIPSLVDKKTKLEYLYGIQTDLENKLNESSVNSSIEVINKEEELKNEQYFLKNSLEEVSDSLRSLRSEINDREGQGMNQIFEDEDTFGRTAQNLESIENKSDLVEKLNRLSVDLQFNYHSRGRGFREDPESLRKISYKLNELYSKIEILTSKVKNEKERDLVGVAVERLKNHIDEVKNQILGKATQIESAGF